MPDTAGSELLIRREGRAGRVTMNRPQALNALNYPMVVAFAAVLQQWENDPDIALIVLDGAGDRGLCAGGDVRALHDTAPQGSALARQFWSTEYRLNARIRRYPKPIVTVMDGIVMGGGIGLASHASHRIVTERSQLAMPETSIGLIPDVGGTWLLAHAPGDIGTYLGLLGERMDGTGAIYANFADWFVPSARLSELVDALATAGGPVEDTIQSFAQRPATSHLAERERDIDAAFRFDSIEAIRKALKGMDSNWAHKTIAELDRRSPLALKLTLAAVRNARGLPALEDALNIEFRLTVRLFEHGEFVEGVRALLVDKDKAPRWKPPTLAEVSPDMVARFFRPLPDQEALALSAPAD